MALESAYFDPFAANGDQPNPEQNVAYFDVNTGQSHGVMQYKHWAEYSKTYLNLDGTPKGLRTREDG